MTKGYKTGGRKKGTPNKLTRELRQMIWRALADAGGVGYLAAQAEKNPSAFLALLGTVWPRQVAGRDGGPIEVEPSDLEVARRLAFLLVRGAQMLDAARAERPDASPPAPPDRSLNGVVSRSDETLP